MICVLELFQSAKSHKIAHIFDSNWSGVNFVKSKIFSQLKLQI